jgi:hypothetical protein
MEIHFMGENLETIEIYIDKNINEQIEVKILDELFKTEKYFIIGYQSFNKRIMLPFKTSKDSLCNKLNTLLDGKYWCQGYDNKEDRNNVFNDIKEVECGMWFKVKNELN